MLLRHWIELGAAILVFIIGAVTKYITHRMRKKMDGFKGINDSGPGSGWKLK